MIDCRFCLISSIGKYHHKKRKEYIYHVCLLRQTFSDQARDIYEEAVETVITVRDFTQVFDAYAQFEKNLISAKMEQMEESGPTDEGITCTNNDTEI